jgi:hypothetical protein
MRLSNQNEEDILMRNKKTIKKVVALIIVIIIGTLFYLTYCGIEKKKEQERINQSADYFFYVIKSNDDISFYEYKLKAQALYLKIECEKDYSIEDLKNAYYEKNELFYDYLNDCGKKLCFPEELISSLDYICEFECDRLFMRVNPEEQDEAIKIFLEEQRLVTDYYGDSRVKLYKLTYEQQMEFYKLYKDSSYVLDDKLMETDEPFGGLQKYEEHLVVTKIDGDTITLEQKKENGKIKYVGTYQNAIDFEVGDKVYVEFYFFAYGDRTYYNIQFEKMEKE